MKFYSTQNKSTFYSLEEAVLKSLPEDNGLFMPEYFPLMPQEFFKNITELSFQDIASEVSRTFLAGDIPDLVIDEIARESVNFPVPLKQIEADTAVLELFHGPTLAFKDVGARFMARVMAWLNRDKRDKLTILVATSGDTGSAVANGFFGVEGIEVIILYPSGKVSGLQEKQLTTLGGNITALEVNGSFDDCQRMVKTAFLDTSLRGSYRLSSANSINIARLLPQCFYYIDAFRQAGARTDIIFSVPSGNFGNLTAGLFAQRMGLPVRHFIASTNVNDSVVRFLHSGNFEAHETKATISNAMDVGNPSNFVRMLDLFNNSSIEMSKSLSAYSFNDSETRDAMNRVFLEKSYTLDPHGAVGYLGLEKYKEKIRQNFFGIFLETAHPSKFIDVVEETLKCKVTLPETLACLQEKRKVSIKMDSEYVHFQEFLMNRL
ncbi:MAG TPA: threonine synthase [Bacteroidia bacterium]|nr:threonine synthase [Bacteroidia bacterium]HNS12904.1 threonine synthase [Bacteroidia bacterium]